MRVLALVPGGVSEQLLFFPTLEHLKHAFPKAEISVAVEPEAKAAYRVSALVKEVFLYDFKQRNSPSDWANLLGIIRDREFEVVLTATQSVSLALLLWLSGTPMRVGYGNSANNLFLTATVPQKTAQYQGLQYHDLLAGLTVSGPCPSAAINVPQKDIDWVSGQIKMQGIGDQGYVLVYGGPTDETVGQQYPADSWAAIIQDFQARQPGLPLVLIQQPETAELVKNLTQRLPNLKVVRPDNVGQVAALIAGANLMLSTDSYPLQLGVALNVFTLALFGGNDPEQRLPSLAGSETRFIGLTSPTGKVADITAKTILDKVWGGT
ncbi:MAG: glycosyltransferase family 9 protein [Cyanobacteria bacterium]|nr:glycosyltransferase family 9 protein [Cyanobacteriota bacterium]